MSDELKPCPSCESETPVMTEQDRVTCRRWGCFLFGPDLDNDGAKWNALPRRDLEMEAKAAAWDAAMKLRSVKVYAIEECERLLAEERKKLGLP